jgi:uroporphyrinogen decarboxylase
MSEADLAENRGGSLTSRARMEAVLAGRLPDRLPVSFWVHNFAREQTVDELVAETMRLQKKFSFDFLKPQSPAHAAALIWGAEVTRPTRPEEWPELIRPALASAADLAAITPRPVSGQLADQVKIVRQLRSEVGSDVPVIGTIFSPLMVMSFMHPGGKPAILEMMREAPEQMSRALDAISATLCEFAVMLLDEGQVDGVFYASTFCGKNELTEAEHLRFHEPHDNSILAACRPGRMNMLHLCGPEVAAARFTEAEPPIVSWELGPHNPGLTAMNSMFDRAMLTGVPGKPDFSTTALEKLRAAVQAAIAETNGRKLMIGPGCSTNPGGDEDLFGMVVDEVRKTPLSVMGNQ